MSRRAQKLIRKIRATVPKFACIPGCSDCCGPVMWNKWEIEQLELVKDILVPKCPYSTSTGCAAYAHRPVVCRLFGAVEGMDCPHGKTPLKRLSRDATKKLTAGYWNLPDFKVLGIDGRLSKNADQESLRGVMNKIQQVVQDESQELL